MKMDIEKLETYEKLLNYILFTDHPYFTLERIKLNTGLSVNKIRTILKVLFEFQILYTKSRVGIFLNKDFLKKLHWDKVEFVLGHEYITYKTPSYELTVKRTCEIEKASEFYESSRYNFEKNVTNFFLLMIYAHYTYNLTYEKTYSCENNLIIYEKIGSIAKNDEVILHAKLITDKYKICT